MDLFMSLLNGPLPNALKNAGSSLRCSMPRWSLNYLLTSAKQLAAGSRSPGKQWRRRWAIRLPPMRACTTVGLTCATVNKTQKARTNNVWSPRCITAEDNNAAHNVATCWSKQSSISFTFHSLPTTRDMNPFVRQVTTNVVVNRGTYLASDHLVLFPALSSA